MRINDVTLAELALVLSAERKRQKLSREHAAAVCGVSTSFIRDAESNPENCSLGKLAKLINGLGLTLEVSGLEVSRLGLPKSGQGLGLAVVPAKTSSQGLIAAAMGLHHADFGVPASQLVETVQGGLADLLRTTSQPSTGLGLASPIAQHGIKNKLKGESS
jgi:HTH-type transcriptional regulator/antitoxin HipB